MEEASCPHGRGLAGNAHRSDCLSPSPRSKLSQAEALSHHCTATLQQPQALFIDSRTKALTALTRLQWIILRY